MGSGEVADTDEVLNETEPASSEQVEAAINWDDPSNPYISRLRGLQGTVQSAQETNKLLMEQVKQLRDQVFQQSLAYLDPQTQRAALLEYEQAQKQEALDAQAREVEARSKRVVIAELSRQYGIPEADLEIFPDPISMQQYAQRVSQIQRRLQNPQPQQAQANVPLQGRVMPVTEPVSSTSRRPITKAADWEEALGNLLNDPRARGL
jgi:hypothetical protein